MIEKFTIYIKLEFGIDMQNSTHKKDRWSDENSTETLSNEVLQNMNED